MSATGDTFLSFHQHRPRLAQSEVRIKASRFYDKDTLDPRLSRIGLEIVTDMNEQNLTYGKLLLQPMGNKETQICFKMQKDGAPVWDQTMIDRLWVTTQREAMIEAGPPPAVNVQPSDASKQKLKKEETKK